MKKRALSLLLALVMVFGLLPVTARAAGSSDGLEYMICNDHVEIAGYSGSAKEVVIPTTYAGLPVTSINDEAFWGCDNMTSISIPDSVTFIGEYAFYDCESLTSISIPKGVASIGDKTFDGCESLTSVSIPDSVISIGEYAFSGCDNLISVSIPDSVTFIGKSAFYSCNELISISIPKGVTSINDYTFGYCENLTSVSIPNGVTSIGAYTFQWCEKLTNVVIPDSVISIGEGAFSHCSKLTTISIPNGVTSILENTFSSCKSLTNVSIPDSVTSIGEDAFVFCESLTSIIIPGSVTHIDDEAFAYGDKLASIYFEGNAPEFGYSVFGGVTANAYYPFGNPTWTVLKSHGGSLTWIPYTPPFYDVPTGSYYADPVLWALENGVTTGTSDTTFSPGNQCLRAHVVTFLWNAVETPEPASTSSSFTDVPAGVWYEKPVLWAVENGITSGVSPNKFGAGDVCSRYQVVYFLWKAAGSPEPKTTVNPFTDVNPGHFFYKAVLWAVENDITSGTSDTTFSPTQPCNRAQVVTFLYAAYN